jgi:hypothetical protein
MTVKIICGEALASCVDSDYVRVSTSSDPNDDTVTLATIQRVIEKSNGSPQSAPKPHVKSLVVDRPMSFDAALGLATCYAERKGIAVVYSDRQGN